MAALLYAGPGSVLTGSAALRGLGLAVPESRRIDVLVPAARRPASVAFVTVHRTTRMPQRVIREGMRSYALPPRALADAARFLDDLGEVRALIASAVQRGDCPLGVLVRELGDGPRRHSARLRQVLVEAAAGIRSIAEGDFLDLIKGARLPRPIFNARLYSADGTFIATADAWWPKAGVAAEVDSNEWHLKPADWERTMRRHARMTSYGILVLHFHAEPDPHVSGNRGGRHHRHASGRKRPATAARLGPGRRVMYRRVVFSPPGGTFTAPRAGRAGPSGGFLGGGRLGRGAGAGVRRGRKAR
jgi:hypothetical protein